MYLFPAANVHKSGHFGNPISSFLPPTTSKRSLLSDSGIVALHFLGISRAGGVKAARVQWTGSTGSHRAASSDDDKSRAWKSTCVGRPSSSIFLYLFFCWIFCGSFATHFPTSRSRCCVRCSLGRRKEQRELFFAPASECCLPRVSLYLYLSVCRLTGFFCMYVPRPAREPAPRPSASVDIGAPSVHESVRTLPQSPHP